MAKRIVFVRHGKSSWEYQVNDKDRPLKERGISDAHLIGAALRSLELPFEASFSSPANRALHTAMIVLRNLNFDLEKFQVTEALYDFSGGTVLEFLRQLDDRYENVLIFGHNHAFTSLVNMLGDVYLENLPTAGLAVIEAETENWRTLESGKTIKIMVPKELR